MAEPSSELRLRGAERTLAPASGSREDAGAGLPNATVRFDQVRSPLGRLLPDGFDDVALAERLHDDHGVLVVPGAWFGAPGTLRVSWLQVGDRLAEGLDRLQRLLV